MTGNRIVKKHSVTIAGHRTSFSLEEAFWQALKEIAKTEGISLRVLIERIDRERANHASDGNAPGGNLSGALRVYVLEHLQGAGS